jgi:hypothetical protein
MTKPDWKPFTRAHSIVGTPIETKRDVKQDNKQTRVYKETDYYQPKDTNYAVKTIPTNIINKITPIKSYSHAVANIITFEKVPTNETTTNLPESIIDVDMQNQLTSLRTMVELMQQQSAESSTALAREINNKMDIKIDSMKTSLSIQYKKDMEETGKINTDKILDMFNEIQLSIATNQAHNVNRMGAMERTSAHIMHQLTPNNGQPTNKRNGSKLNESFMDEDDDNERSNNNKENYSSVHAESVNQDNNEINMN